MIYIYITSGVVVGAMVAWFLLRYSYSHKEVMLSLQRLEHNSKQLEEFTILAAREIAYIKELVKAQEKSTGH